jgi:hypothetical protein
MAEQMKSAEAWHSPMRYALAGLLIAPLAWLVQMVVAETLAAQSCYPFNTPLSAPLVPWMRPALVAISALCLVAGGVGGVIAWRNLRRLAREEASASRRRTGLVWFVSRVAMMCSALFLFALIATDVALAIVSPCRWW